MSLRDRIVPSDVCAKQRLKSACISTLSDFSVCWALFGYQMMHVFFSLSSFRWVDKFQNFRTLRTKCIVCAHGDDTHPNQCSLNSFGAKFQTTVIICFFLFFFFLFFFCCLFFFFFFLFIYLFIYLFLTNHRFERYLYIKLKD